MSGKLRIGIIGAGASGLIAAKTFRSAGHCVSIFEKSSRVGGIWNYTENLHTDSSLYESLHTNLPACIMQLSDFPFLTDKTSFPCHRRVLSYLEQYCERFQVTPFVRFNCRVIKIEALNDRLSKRYRVSYTRKNVPVEALEFDKIVICNGHFSEPIVGEMEGLQNFKGQVVHSHDYRRPDAFVDKRVVVVGFGASGQDISMELVKNGARKVLVSMPKAQRRSIKDDDVNLNVQSAVKDERVFMPRLCRINSDGVLVFEDGTSYSSADAVIFCTGYRYCVQNLVEKHILLPHKESLDLFRKDMRASDTFDQLIALARNGRIVAPLYQQILAIADPSIAFLGIPTKVLPFVCFELQAKWLLAVYNGSVTLPSTSEMMQKLWEHARNEPALQALHVLGSKQRMYFRKLALQSGGTFNEIILDMYDDVGALRKAFPFEYRNAKYFHDENRDGWTRELQIACKTLREGEERHGWSKLTRLFNKAQKT